MNTRSVAAWMQCRPADYEFVSMFDSKREARSYARRNGFRLVKVAGPK